MAAPRGREAAKARASSADAARVAICSDLSPVLRRKSDSVVIHFLFSRYFRAFSRSSSSGTTVFSPSPSLSPPTDRRYSRIKGAWGWRMVFPAQLSPSARVKRSTVRNHNGAGSMARTASRKVQKYRSRRKAASRSMDSGSRGSSSSCCRTALSFVSSPDSMLRTTPSVRRLPLPKGTITRTPGFRSISAPKR